MDVDTELDALVKTLSINVAHHMHKERSAIFPVVCDSRRLDLPLLQRSLEVRRQAIFQEEGDRVAARLQPQAHAKAVQCELNLPKGRAAAKARNVRRGAVVIHALALSEGRRK